MELNKMCKSNDPLIVGKATNFKSKAIVFLSPY